MSILNLVLSALAVSLAGGLGSACQADPNAPSRPPESAAPTALAPAESVHAQGPAPAAADDPAPVSVLFESYIRERARLQPTAATRWGLHEYDHWLTRHDGRSTKARRELVEKTLAALEAAGAEGRTPADLVDWKLLRAQLRVELAEQDRLDPRTARPGLALDGVGAINDLLIRDFAPKEERVKNALSRMRALLPVCDDLSGALKRPPELWVRMAIEDLDGALSFIEETTALIGKGTPGLRESQMAASEALTNYRDDLQRRILPNADGEFAVGRAHFDFLLRELHLLDLDADRLLALGREQFARTVADLESTARAIDSERGWRELLAEMMEEHPSAEELLPAYLDEVARARQYLLEHDLVSIPEETLQILETPAFMRSTVPFAAYDSPAPLDASRLGTFYVTPVPEAHIVSDIPGTTWHEAYPGHHLQLVYAKDNPSLVRKLNDSPLLSEGWGLYCEELAHETGYYDDPRERLMQLNWKLQRAARVILDTSLHAFGMPYDEAVNFLVEQVGMGRGQAEASVNAYTQSPTYFSCYLVGMLEIVRIREAFRARLGERFTLREFHERLLRCGNIPPALIEEELERTWR
ncbi:MAG: DUF885 domain-containing protein [Planctomycetota bacterium]